MSVLKRPSPNCDARGEEEIKYLIIHYTNIPDTEEAVAWLTDPEKQVSAHYVIGEDGLVHQLVDEEQRAWHAGVSYWQGQNNLNAASIGIELVHPGHMHGYRAFADAQIAALIELCKDIMLRHWIEPEYVLAHSDIAPSRKEDPGELFPWRRLAEAGVGVWPDPSDEDAVKARGLIMERALTDLGYDPRLKFRDRLVAFQRHFVPEVFAEGQEGRETGLTRARLYALLAGHLLVARDV